MNPSDQSSSNSTPPATFRPGPPEAAPTPAPMFVAPGFRTAGLPMAGSRWRRADALDGVIDEAIIGRRIVGAEVIAARDGEIVYRRAAGYADREARRLVRE